MRAPRVYDHPVKFLLLSNLTWEEMIVAQGIADQPARPLPVEPSAWPEIPEDHNQRSSITALQHLLFPIIAFFSIAITVYDLFF